MTLQSEKTTYTERSEPDEDTAEKGCNRGEERDQDPGLSGGVPIADREAFPGGRIQHWFAVRAVWRQPSFDPSLGKGLPAEGSRGVGAQAA